MLHYFKRIWHTLLEVESSRCYVFILFITESEDNFGNICAGLIYLSPTSRGSKKIATR